MKKITQKILFSLGAMIALGNVAAYAQPAVSAPTPTYSSSKVISIYSDTYTGTAAVTNLDLNPGWGQATVVSQIQIGTDNVLKYVNLNYQGTTFDHIFPIATNMQYMHIDIWSVDETSVQIFPICWDGSKNETEKFKQITLTASDFGMWKSYDIPLTDFTSQGLTMSDVYQMKIVGSGGKTVYFDNIYFYNPSTDTDTQAPTAFTATGGDVTFSTAILKLNATDNSGSVVYTITYGSNEVNTSGTSGTEKDYMVTGLTAGTMYNFSVVCKDATGNEAANSPISVQLTTADPIAASPTPLDNAADVLSVYSDTYTASATNVTYANWYMAPWSDITLAGGGSAKMLMGNADGAAAGIEFVGLDVSTMINLHIDVYPTTGAASLIKYNVVPVGGGGAGWTFFTGLVANQWNSVNIPVSSLDLNGANVYQIGFGTFGGLGTLYLDNVYFTKSTSTGLKAIENSNAVNCYPNLVSGSLTITANSEMSQVVIHNMMGQTIKNIDTNAVEQTIDLTGVSSGNYFVTVKLANGKVSNLKFIKL